MRFVGDSRLPPQLARLHHLREEENIGVSLPHLQRLHLRPHCPHNATRGRVRYWYGVHLLCLVWHHWRQRSSSHSFQKPRTRLWHKELTTSQNT
ncbi:hypothetical protein Pcinc_001801 [Petrolisthes cinctipes]|uniref:Uncharacterized protein n=1 Tax=Petrolisthes cinctipes TaxID=88211 RepID=A0AAE1GMM9_PETCI|nr:hypothetical protein Pcinc_001801 [Petrolisthes cinctipes]